MQSGRARAARLTLAFPYYRMSERYSCYQNGAVYHRGSAVKLPLAAEGPLHICGVFRR